MPPFVKVERIFFCLVLVKNVGGLSDLLKVQLNFSSKIPLNHQKIAFGNIFTSSLYKYFMIQDIDQLYNQSRLDPDETILDVQLRGSFLTPELTSFSRHCLQVSVVLKDTKGIRLCSKVMQIEIW